MILFPKPKCSLEVRFRKIFYLSGIFSAIPMESRRKTLTSLRHSALAPASWKTRNSQWRKFFQFCLNCNLSPLPASTDTVCLFIAFLSTSLEYSTISNYVSSLLPLHEHHNLQAPDISHFSIKHALTGVKRSRLERPNKKCPILPSHLQSVYDNLYLVPAEARVAFWCACLVAFYSLLRKSNLFVGELKRDHNEESFLKFGDVTVTENNRIALKARSTS